MDEIIKEGELIVTDKRYLQLLDEARQKVTSTRIQVAKAASRGQFELYWWLGEQIVAAQNKYGWGRSIVEHLAKDLRQSFPETTKGFSSRNLWYMRNIYNKFNGLPILQQVAAEIPWAQLMVIADKVESPTAARYYMESSREQGWTRSTLIMQIQSQAHERHLLSLKQHNFTQALPQHLAEQADNTLKDIYMLDTLGLTPPVLEAEIESRMVAKIKNVMLELGYGFTFMGNQYRIQAHGNEYFIDLLFYNRRLQCLVALELKKGKFEPEHTGKMNFYLNLLDEFVKEPHEHPSIGIILCSERDRFEVEYALRRVNSPVGVAEFRLAKTLPKELLDKLPNPKELEVELRRGLDAEDINEIETDNKLEKICV